MAAASLAAFLSSVFVTVVALVHWSAARQRELVYFHLTLDRPGSGYFRSARVDRERYSRIAAAAGALVLVSLAELSRALRGPVSGEQAALLWGQVFGLVVLAYTLLRAHYAQHALFTLVAAGAGLISVAAELSALTGWQPEATGVLGAWVLQALAAGGTCLAMRAVPKEQRLVAPGAFLLWLVGPITHVPALGMAAIAVFCAALGARIYRDLLQHHESLELGHHRMQRQHEVIVRFLGRIADAYSAALDLEQVLRLIVSAGVETTGAGAGAIYLLDPETRKLQMRSAQGPFPPLYRDVPVANLMRRWEELTRIAMRQRFDVGEGVVGQVAATGQPVRLPDAQAAGVLVGSVCDPVRRHAMLLVPLTLRGEAIGVMAVLNKRNADEFSVEDQFLLGTLAEQAGFYIDNARMVAALAAQERVQRELQIARDIQRMLLPAEPPALPGFDLSAFSQPALEMGGDYYDFFWVTEGQLGIVVADVSGKGVPAALTMAMLRTVMRTHALGNGSVRETLERTNLSLSGDLRRGSFITISYGVLDVQQRTLTWARAGHEPTLLVRGGQVETHTPSGAAVGVLPHAGFAADLEVETLSLQPGDSVVIYTDGITEAMNSAGEEFGMDRLLQALRGHARASSADRIESIQRSVNAFVGDTPQQDDITLVVLTA